MTNDDYNPSYLALHQRMVARMKAESQEDARAAEAGNYVPITSSGTVRLGAPQEVYPEKDSEVFVVFTTQPQGHSVTERVDGQTELVLQFPRMKEAILNTPGFPQSVPVPPSPKSYSIVQIPSKGLGMVATRDIPFGELIVAERAMLIMVRGSIVAPPPDGTESLEEMYRASSIGAERYLECAIERMEANPRTRKNVEAFKKLCNSHLHDGTGPLGGIVRTNSFGIDLPLDKDNAHGAVFDKLSRINHSCSPNTTRWWNTASLSLQIYAVRDIKQGEEITTWYTLPLEPSSERRSHLAKYDIDCQCRACTDPASERNRTFLSLFEESYFSVPMIVQTVRTAPTHAHAILLHPILRILKLIEDEGVEAVEIYPMVLHSLAMIYFALGDMGQAKRYNQRWRIWQRNCATVEAGAMLEACFHVLEISKGVSALL